MANNRQIAPWPFVEIDWIDSMSVSHWSCEADTPEASDMFSRGWLIKETDKSVVLAGTHYRSDDKPMFGELIAIPHCAITRRKVLKI